MAIIMDMRMTSTGTRMDNAGLYRLMAWLSPAYPVGAFSYSHGIEWLVESGAIHDKDSLALWQPGPLAGRSAAAGQRPQRRDPVRPGA
jgi:urease accessory protein